MYLDPREVMGETTTVKDGVTHLRFAPIAAAFVPDIPPGVIRTDATIPAELPKSAGLEEFPPNAIPLLLGTVRFMFKGKSTGAGVEVQRQNIRAIPYTGITTHAAQGANTAKTVVHFCLRMLRLLKDPALVLVALTRVKRLKDLILLSPMSMENARVGGVMS